MGTETWLIENGQLKQTLADRDREIQKLRERVAELEELFLSQHRDVERQEAQIAKLREACEAARDWVADSFHNRSIPRSTVLEKLAAALAPEASGEERT